MGLLSIHKCSGPKLKCFDCNATICPQCMVATATSMMCRRCVPGKGNRANAQVVTADLLKLQTVSVGLSILAFSLFSLLITCVT